MEKLSAPILNWKEIELHVRAISEETRGASVDRILIPLRAEFPGGYLKSEFAFQIRTRSSDWTLIWSVRAQMPYFALATERLFKPATQATHSPFGLLLSKLVRGLKIQSIRTLKKDRCVWMEFSGGMALVIHLIPAMPEAFLIDLSQGSAAEGWKVLGRSRSNAENLDEVYKTPDASRAPDDMPVRSEWIESPAVYYQVLEKDLQQEALQTRWANSQKELQKILKALNQQIRSQDEQLKSSQAEGEWKHYGDLLKSVMHESPPIEKDKTRKVFDYTIEKEIKIPCDPKLTIQNQIEKFYTQAKRKSRRIQESQERIRELTDKKSALSGFLKAEPAWPELKKLEESLGIAPGAAKKEQQSSGALWPGRRFKSKDGMEIWVGKTEKENLELTFKKARGNDQWLHVKGRTSAHAIVPVPSGKSASLETLLDAAHLVIHYSGYSGEAKTEVDYTFKKYVKRIKDSTQVSYTQNKTLIVQFDAKRIERLFQSVS